METTWTQWHVKDFGAVGDGVTDDGPAIAEAVRRAVALGKPVKLQFTPRATYWMASGGELPGVGQAALSLSGARQVILEGEETAFCLGPGVKCLDVVGCEEVVIRGFRFYNRPHVAYLGKLLDIHQEQMYVTVRTPEPLHFEGDMYDATGVFFAMPAFNFREHLYVTRILRLPEPNTYRLLVQQDHSNRRVLRIIEEKHLDLVVPNPGMAHVGVGFHILSSREIRLEDCEIMESGQFVGAIKGNLGPLYFERVNLRAHPDTVGPICAWRDGFHCKDNRGPIHWKSCIIRDLYDDTFNISCTYLNVRERLSDTELAIACTENGGAYYDLSQGDIVTVTDTVEGKMISRRNRIRKVIEQHGADIRIALEEPLPADMRLENCKVAVESLCAPGSTIEDCYVAGTVRFRGPITVRRTHFKLLVLWLENECDIEGPIPRDMLFEDCTFEGEYPVRERYLEKYISIKTCQKAPGLPSYKCENIRFRRCRIEPAYFYVEEGNDVQVTDE